MSRFSDVDIIEVIQGRADSALEKSLLADMQHDPELQQRYEEWIQLRSATQSVHPSVSKTLKDNIVDSVMAEIRSDRLES